MQLPHEAIGRNRQDRRRIDLGAIGAEKGLPDAGEGHQHRLGRPDEIGLLCRSPIGRAILQLPPLIKPGRRHQHAAMADRAAKRRLLGDGLDTGVDHQRQIGRVLGPIGDKAPAHKKKSSPSLNGGDDGERLRRRDIVARRKVRMISIAKEAAHLIRRRSQRQSATHRQNPLSRPRLMASLVKNWQPALPYTKQNRPSKHSAWAAKRWSWATGPLWETIGRCWNWAKRRK